MIRKKKKTAEYVVFNFGKFFECFTSIDYHIINGGSDDDDGCGGGCGGGVTYDDNDGLCTRREMVEQNATLYLTTAAISSRCVTRARTVCCATPRDGPFPRAHKSVMIFFDYIIFGWRLSIIFGNDDNTYTSFMNLVSLSELIRDGRPLLV